MTQTINKEEEHSFGIEKNSPQHSENYFTTTATNNYNPNDLNNQESFIEVDEGENTFQYLSEESKGLKVDELAAQYGINQNFLNRKIDLFVIPPLCLLFFISYFNKSYFGLILLDGVTKELKINADQYGYVWLSFFFPYTGFQIFGNVILTYVRPHFWMSITVLVYGAVAIGTSHISNLSQFIGCQFLHGMFQSGTEVAAYYLVSHFYERNRSQIRFSLIYGMSAVAGVVGTLINYGCNENLMLVNGLSSWRWLLIIEGAITMGFAVILFFVLPDFPEGARFFSNDETIFLVKKLEVWGGKSGYSLKVGFRDVLECLTDPLIFLPSFISFTVSYSTYGLSLLEPISVELLGYTGIEGARRLIYNWIVAFAWIIILSIIANYVKMKSPLIIFNICICMISNGIIFIYIDQYYKSTAKYTVGIIFFMCYYAILPILVCWSSMNLCGHLRKSVGIAAEMTSGSLGGLIVYFCFVSNSGGTDKYKIGYIVAMVFDGISLISVFIYIYYCYRQNQLKRTSEYKRNWETMSEKKRVLLGDKSPSFEYCY